MSDDCFEYIHEQRMEELQKMIEKAMGTSATQAPAKAAGNSEPGFFRARSSNEPGELHATDTRANPKASKS